MKKNNPGFTMLELIMVVIIIGLLAAVAAPRYSLFVEKSRAAEAINYIGAIKKAQVSFASGNVIGYGSPNMATLGLSDSTQLWNYSTQYIAIVDMIYIIANRTTGDNAGSNIYFYYYNYGGHSWGGTHPGVPKD